MPSNCPRCGCYTVLYHDCDEELRTRSHMASQMPPKPSTDAEQLLALRESVRRLVDAIKPFSKEADSWEGFEESDVLVEPFDKMNSNITVGDLRKARSEMTAFLAENKEFETNNES